MGGGVETPWPPRHDSPDEAYRFCLRGAKLGWWYPKGGWGVPAWVLVVSRVVAFEIQTGWSWSLKDTTIVGGLVRSISA